MFNLARAIYTSRARFTADFDENGVDPTVAEILQQARTNNYKDHISGALYFADGHFFQVIEGPRRNVENLIDRIAADPRHEDMKISSMRRIRRRYFKTWSMKYLPLNEQVTELVKQRGYGSFNPCEFHESDINALIQQFAQAKDPQLKSEDLTDHHFLKPSFIKRLLTPFGSRRTS